MSSYSTGASNFSHVDAALTQLTERVTLAQADATELLKTDPCHSSFAQEKLRIIQSQLGDAAGFVADLTHHLGPVNTTLNRVEGSIQKWGGKGELVRWWAVLAPALFTLIYVLLELAASESRSCFEVSGKGTARDAGRCHSVRKLCSTACALSRCLGRTVGVVTLLSLFGSSCVYLVLAIGAADFCSAPDAVLVDGMGHEDVAQRDVIAYFALCPPINSTSAQVRQFEGYFDQAESAFQELDQAFEAYDLLCPVTKSSGSGDEYARCGGRLLSRRGAIPKLRRDPAPVL